MTFTIPQGFFIYWLFALNFEIIHLLFLFKSFKAKAQKSQYYPVFKMYYEQSPSIKLLWDNLFSISNAVIGFVLVVVVCPFMLPFSVMYLLKQAIGYRSKLEKQSDAEADIYDAIKKQSEEFMKKEGCFDSVEDVAKSDNVQ